MSAWSSNDKINRKTLMPSRNTKSRNFNNDIGQTGTTQSPEVKKDEWVAIDTPKLDMMLSSRRVF